MIKVLVFDVDGTLIKMGENNVQPSAVKAIRQLHDEGFVIVVATGRGYYITQDDVKNLLPVDYYVCVNGCCSNDKNGKLYQSTPMSQQDTENMIALFNQRGYSYALKFDDCVQCYRDLEGYCKRYCSFSVKREWIHDNTATQDYHKTHGMPLDIFFYTNDDPDKFDLWNCSETLSFVLARRDHSAFECFNARCNKANGLRELVESLGYSMDECLAFGDSQNDIEMLQQCGLGVAMGNATDDVKAIADYITTNVDDDGVVNALKYYTLI